MGQGKKRKKDIEKFLASLSKHERFIYDLAKRSYEWIIRARNFQGACYHITFLLKTILREHGIETDAVIGFVNDGTDDLMISHGWLEYEGRKIDVALANPNHGQTPGPVVILDQKFQAYGTANYTYHRERGENGELAIQQLLTSDLSQVRLMAQQKEYEHRFMLEISCSEDRIMEYLISAPVEASYKRLKEILEGDDL